MAARERERESEKEREREREREIILEIFTDSNYNRETNHPTDEKTGTY